VLTEARWFPGHSDSRDTLVPMASAPHLYDREAAKALRRAGFAVERIANSTWQILKAPE
jgi:hypothetical protein